MLVKPPGNVAKGQNAACDRNSKRLLAHLAAALVALQSFTAIPAPAQQEQAPAQQAQLTDAERLALTMNAATLLKEVARLVKVKNDESAVKLYAQVVAIFQKLGDKSGESLNSEYFAEALSRLGRHEEAAQRFAQASMLYEEQQKPLDAARMYSRIGDCRRDLKDDEGAAKAYSEASRRFRELQDDNWLATNSVELAQVLYRLGRWAEAAAQYDVAARFYEVSKLEELAAWMRGRQGDCYCELKDDASAAKAYEDCLKKFAALKQNHGLTFASNLARAHYRMKQYHEAISSFGRAATAYESIGDNVNAAWMHGWIGDCFKELQDEASAIKAYKESITRFEALKHDVGLALNTANLGLTLFRLGRYQDALPYYQKALEITKRAKGEEHADYAIYLCNLSILYDQLSDYPQAISLARRALEITKKAVGEGHADYAIRMDNLSTLYDHMGDYGRAEPLALQAIEITKKALGENHPDYAIRLHNTSVLYEHMGAYTRAEPLARQALEITGKSLGEHHADYALRLDHLAQIYYRTAEYGRAEPLYRQALEVKKRVLGEAHPNYALGLNNLALLYAAMGEYGKAEPLYRQALEVYKTVFGELHSEYATVLDNFAVLYKLQGSYARAEPLYRQALEIRKKTLGEAHPHYALSLNNLGALRRSMGDDAAAEPLYRQASEIYKKALGELHPEYATSLYSLANLYKSLDDYARAEPLYRQSLEIKKSSLGVAHPEYATSLASLAELYRSMGNYTEAERLQGQALEIRKIALGEGHPDVADSLESVALLKEATGDYAAAESLYRQSLEIRKKTLGEAHPDYALSLNFLAELYEEIGELDKAEPFFREALRISRQNLELASIVQSERQQLAMLSDVRQRLDSFVALAAREPKFGIDVFDDVLAWKGLVLARQRASRAVANRPGLAPVLEELQATATRLARLSFAAPDPAKAAAWKEQISELSHRKEDLEAKLSAASAEYRATNKPAAIADVQAALPDGSALIELLEYRQRQLKSQKEGGGWRSEKRLAAFVVLREGNIKVVDVGPIAPIGEALDAWRSSAGKSAASRQAAQTLREKLWLPLEQHLAGTTIVIVSPDGELGKLPFAALPGKEPGTYLLEEYTLAIVPASQLVVELTEQRALRQSEGNMLVVADVNYGSRMVTPAAKPKKQFAGSEPKRAARDDAEARFGPLAGTRGELATIQKLYRDNFGADGITTLEAAAASREALIHEAPRHLYLHLATHGYFAAPRFQSALDRTLGRDDQPTLATPAGPTTGTVTEKEKKIAGIGAQLNVENDAVVVVRVVDGGAAALDGRLRAGDQILGVAQGSGEFVDTTGMKLDDVVALIRGEVGLILRLRVKTLIKEESQIYELKRVDLSGLVAAPAPVYATQQQISGYHPGLLSGLALAGANQPRDDDDGILTAEEVSSLDLTGVKLVVLSACETGLGKSAGGEGLLGLQRAFQVAGASTVIASLWKVDDVATRDLMEQFYNNLWNKNMGKLEALREAQLWMLKKRGPRGLKEFAGDIDANKAQETRLPPYYWAAFVLSGDWR